MKSIKVSRSLWIVSDVYLLVPDRLVLMRMTMWIQELTTADMRNCRNFTDNSKDCQRVAMNVVRVEAVAVLDMG